jgi:hypothetical protein
MPTGYEVRMYEDLHRIAKALERIADELERLPVYAHALAAHAPQQIHMKGGGTHGQHQHGPEVSE